MKSTYKLLFIINCCAVILAHCAISAHAQVLRKKNAPVQSTPTPDSRVETKLPAGQGTSPGADKGIIIVGGKGRKYQGASHSGGPFEVRDRSTRQRSRPTRSRFLFPSTLRRDRLRRTVT